MIDAEIARVERLSLQTYQEDTNYHRDMDRALKASQEDTVQALVESMLSPPTEAKEETPSQEVADYRLALQLSEVKEEAECLRALEDSLLLLPTDSQAPKASQEETHYRLALQLSNKRDDSPLRHYVFLPTDKFLEEKAPAEVVQDVLRSTFPSTQGFQMMDVEGDGKCLLHALSRGTGRTTINGGDFVRACRQFFVHHGETCLEHVGDTVIDIKRGLRDDQLIAIWDRINREANDLPSNMITILQYAIKARVLCLSYDPRSDTSLTAAMYDGYREPGFQLGGRYYADTTRMVIIFNNGGHYWLVDNHQDIELKYRTAQKIEAGRSPFLVIAT